MLSKIDLEHKYLTIVKERISFSDITNIEWYWFIKCIVV
jgi:hypothetical protein